MLVLHPPDPLCYARLIIVDFGGVTLGYGAFVLKMEASIAKHPLLSVNVENVAEYRSSFSRSHGHVT